MPDVAIVIVDRLCSSAIHHVGDCVQWEVDKGWTSDDAVAAAADTSAPTVPSGLPSRGQASRWVHREACRFSDEHRRLLSRFTSSEELPSVLCGKTLLKHSLDRRIQLPDPIVNDRDLSQFQFSRWFDLLVIMKTSRRQQPWIGLPNKRDRKVPTTVKPLPPNPLGRHRHCHRNLVEPAATVNRLKEMQTSEKPASPLLPRAYYAVKQRPGDRVEAAVSIAGDSDHAI